MICVYPNLVYDVMSTFIFRRLVQTRGREG